jgi:hypothetical protein
VVVGAGEAAITKSPGRVSLTLNPVTPVSAGAVSVIRSREVVPEAIGLVRNAFETVTGTALAEMVRVGLVLRLDRLDIPEFAVTSPAGILLM